jgi:hypothetical protein
MKFLGDSKFFWTEYHGGKINITMHLVSFSFLLYGLTVRSVTLVLIGVFVVGYGRIAQTLWLGLSSVPPSSTHYDDRGSAPQCRAGIKRGDKVSFQMKGKKLRNARSIFSYAKGTELTMVDPLLSLSIRAVSLIALLLCVPVVAHFRFAPGALWAEYVGIFFHLVVFLLVFKLPAPEWARAAGYGWLLLDVDGGLNLVDPQCTGCRSRQRCAPLNARAGRWIVMASLQGSLTAKLVGLPAGAILFAYTFASPFLPTVWLSPASILVLVWFAILTWQNGI